MPFLLAVRPPVPTCLTKSWYRSKFWYTLTALLRFPDKSLGTVRLEESSPFMYWPGRGVAMRKRRRAAAVLTASMIVFLWSSTVLAGGYHRYRWHGGYGHRHGGYPHAYHGYDYWAGAWAVGLGMGFLSALLLTPRPAAYPPPPPSRTLVCEPTTYQVRRLVDPQTGRFYWVHEPNPRRCWYEYR